MWFADPTLSVVCWFADPALSVVGWFADQTFSVVCWFADQTFSVVCWFADPMRFSFIEHQWTMQFYWIEMVLAMATVEKL